MPPVVFSRRHQPATRVRTVTKAENLLYLMAEQNERRLRYVRKYLGCYISNGGFLPVAGDYAAALGARLRAVRGLRGLSLMQVERESAGRFKAVVVGSYERGERAVTVSRLAELAEFYGVPTQDLLPVDSGAAAGAPRSGDRKLKIDLPRLLALPARQAGPLARYALAIQQQRGTKSTRVLTIREKDLQTLAVVYNVEPPDLTQMLNAWGVLTAEPPA